MEIIRHLPNFEDGVIIRAEKMKQLSDQVFLLPNLIYYNYTNGIISGCEVYESNGNLVLTKGVICLDEKLFIIDKNIEIPYYSTDKLTYLKITCLDKCFNKNGDKYIFSINLSEEQINKNYDEIELCRFKLQKGARLRYIYDDFEDMNTEFDTINIIYTKHSSKNFPTVSLKILKNFSKEMLSLNPLDQIDIFFCMQILGLNNVMNVEEIVYYIESKTNQKIDNINNYKIYRELLKILNNERSKMREEKIVKREKKKILIY